VNAVLVSSYESLVALPFLGSLRARIYCTAPALAIGSALIDELLQHMQLANDSSDSSVASQGREMYTRADADAVLARVQIVNFEEKITLCGKSQVCAMSSGFALGSCNWKISSAGRSVAYITASSMRSRFTLPCSPLNADVYILTNLARHDNPSALESIKNCIGNRHTHARAHTLAHILAVDCC
jgi:integrator complex subunit 9